MAPTPLGNMAVTSRYSSNILHLNLLPPEILLNIATRLSHKDKFNLMRTCREWATFLVDQACWCIQDLVWVGNYDHDVVVSYRLFFCYRMTLEINRARKNLTQLILPCGRWASEILNYAFTSGHAGRLKSLCIKYAPGMRDRFRLATKCDLFDVLDCAETLQVLHLEGVQLISSGDAENPIGLDHLEQLRELTLRECFIDVPGSLPSSIETLTLLCNTFSEDDTLTRWAKAKLPHLRHLTVSINEGDWSVEECTSLLQGANAGDAGRVLDLDLTMGFHPGDDQISCEHVLAFHRFLERYGHLVVSLTTVRRDATQLFNMLWALESCPNLRRVTYANASAFNYLHIGVFVGWYPKSVKEVLLCRTRLNEEIERPEYDAKVRKAIQEFHWYGMQLRVCPTKGRWPEDFDCLGNYDGPAIDEGIHEIDEASQWELTAIRQSRPALAWT